MTPTVVLFTIFAAITAVAVTLTFIRKRRHSSSEPVADSAAFDDAHSCFMKVYPTCLGIIDKALESLTSGDDIAACRNLDVASATLHHIGEGCRKSFDRNGTADSHTAFYISNMISSTGKIAESARHIVTRGKARLTLAANCDIDTLRDSLTDATDADSIKDASSRLTDRTRHLIAVQSASMTKADFNDESVNYDCLMLLYLLLSFAKSSRNALETLDALPAAIGHVGIDRAEFLVI